MAKTLQFRRGTTSELSSVTGSVGELFVNTEKDTVVVMDGSTSGGFELVNLSATQTLTNKTLTSPVISTISNTGTLTLPTSTGTIALTSDIPTNNNALTNGAGYITASSSDTLTNKTLDDATLTGTLTAGGGVGTSGQVLKSTGTGVEWTSLTDNDTNTTYTVSAVDSGDNAIIRLTGSDASTDDVTLAAGSNITITPVGDTITIASTASGGALTIQDEGSTLSTAATTLNFVGSGVTASGTGSTKTITISGGGGGGDADLSAIAEDVLPGFDEVYDIGSSTYKWYDGFFTNSINIDTISLSNSSGTLVINSDVTVGSLLVDTLLLSENTITADASTALQYLGDKGVVEINNSNLDVREGDWIGVPVAETTTTTIDNTIDFSVDFVNDTGYAQPSGIYGPDSGSNGNSGYWRISFYSPGSGESAAKSLASRNYIYDTLTGSSTWSNIKMQVEISFVGMSGFAPANTLHDVIVFKNGTVDTSGILKGANVGGNYVDIPVSLIETVYEDTNDVAESSDNINFYDPVKSFVFAGTYGDITTTTTPPLTTGAEGIIRYNKDEGRFEGYNAEGWASLGGLETNADGDSIITGNLVVSGDITSTSDETLKENIKSIEGALDIVTKLSGKMFTMKSDETQKEKVGFIAQEIEQHLPQVVSTDPNGIKSVSYGNVAALLVEAIKELNQKIEDLKK